LKDTVLQILFNLVVKISEIKLLLSQIIGKIMGLFVSKGPMSHLKLNKNMMGRIKYVEVLNPW
jgi:hypothetical protein